MSKKYLFIFAIFFGLNIFADEGMWVPYQMNKKNFVPVVTITNFLMLDLFKHPMSASGWMLCCFCLDQGLIATNYHCIEGSYLQFNSNAEILFETGFVAS